MKDIDWVSQNPEKYGKRLIFEAEQLKASYPLFGFHIDNRELFVEGPLITRSNNVYLARAYYPSNYPYSPPSPIITDRDVVDFCNTYGMHNFHNYGTFRDVGIKLCVMKPDDVIGEGWKLNYSVVTIINYMALWLHAYEYKKEKGIWLLPEA
ncbi:MAG: hypothetical protein PHS92_03345 [Candidatus Gracilibacteria bacterium]|nr:hypothetical protein [Candidatus Gracilibacteria bacterium]